MALTGTPGIAPAEKNTLARDPLPFQAGVNGHPPPIELPFHQVVEGMAALVACLTPEGAVDFCNRRVLDYFGKTLRRIEGVGEHGRRSPG